MNELLDELVTLSKETENGEFVIRRNPNSWQVIIRNNIPAIAAETFEEAIQNGINVIIKNRTAIPYKYKL